MSKTVIILFFTSICFAFSSGNKTFSEKDGFKNSLGMEFVNINPGSFIMGDTQGEYDEKPVHKVNIKNSFFIGTTQVTNEQYEQFDPSHMKLRGKYGISKEDNEAVIFVSWHDAVAFCRWLSKKEGKTYRLPTEAEWEYAARAGTITEFNTGDSLPSEFLRNQGNIWGAESVPLHVKTTTPNAWGLYDMHGLVEEWCYDWYGPYTEEEKSDPVGRAGGSIKVTRGGSHGTPVKFLRSSTRMGTLPEDKSWVIGFRVVQGELPGTKPMPMKSPAKWAENVSQKKYEWGVKPAEPYFKGPIPFVKVPPGSQGPLYSSHNHKPSVTWLNNGDLFAVWFTGGELGREMSTAASRLKAGTDEWTEADVLFNAPTRNQTGSSLFIDKSGKLYWFNGLSAYQGYRENNALIMSTSDDNGMTWSHPNLINPERNDPERVNQPIDNIESVLESTIREDGSIIIYSDTHRFKGGGTALKFINLEKGTVEFSEGTIAGIHARAVKLKDGSFLAFGRGLSGYAGMIPTSISHDAGNTWEYFNSEFPAISMGQRLVIMRLKEGPLLFVSFAGKLRDQGKGMSFKMENGESFTGYGMFGALSFDEGKTWPVRKLITPADGKTYNGEGWTKNFTATFTHAEPAAYLTATQTPDGIIQLFSSGLHYSFNMEWIMKPPAVP